MTVRMIAEMIVETKITKSIGDQIFTGELQMRKKLCQTGFKHFHRRPQFRVKQNIATLSQPPFILDMSPSNWFLFIELKYSLKDYRDYRFEYLENLLKKNKLRAFHIPFQLKISMWAKMSGRNVCNGALRQEIPTLKNIKCL